MRICVFLSFCILYTRCYATPRCIFIYIYITVYMQNNAIIYALHMYSTRTNAYNIIYIYYIQRTRLRRPYARVYVYTFCVKPFDDIYPFRASRRAPSIAPPSGSHLRKTWNPLVRPMLLCNAERKTTLTFYITHITNNSFLLRAYRRSRRAHRRCRRHATHRVLQ